MTAASGVTFLCTRCGERVDAGLDRPSGFVCWACDAKSRPRVFVLRRNEDETGVSGTGDVAWGVEFPDGSCALRWNTEHTSTAVYESLDTLVKIHGHNGKTEVVWA